MGFIQKRIQQKKLEKEEQLKREYCFYMLVIEGDIDDIKYLIKEFASNKKNTRENDINQFIWYLERIEEHYKDFLHYIFFLVYIV